MPEVRGELDRQPGEDGTKVHPRRCERVHRERLPSWFEGIDQQYHEGAEAADASNNDMEFTRSFRHFRPRSNPIAELVSQSIPVRFVRNLRARRKWKLQQHVGRQSIFNEARSPYLEKFENCTNWTTGRRVRLGTDRDRLCRRWTNRQNAQILAFGAARQSRTSGYTCIVLHVA